MCGQWTGVGGLKVFKHAALFALPPAEAESFQLGDLVPAADDGVESVRPEGDPDAVWELLDEGDMNDIPQ